MAAFRIAVAPCQASSHPRVGLVPRQLARSNPYSFTLPRSSGRKLSASSRQACSRRVSAIAHPAAGGRNGSVRFQETTVDLCIFPMWYMPLPTSKGSLNVFEPHMVALLQVVQQVAAASLDNIPARFGTLPKDWVYQQMQVDDTVAPPSLAYLGDAPPPAFGSLAAADSKIMGVSCDIESVVGDPDGAGEGGFLVQYHATRRFKPSSILRRKPFLVVRGTWVEDERGRSSSSFGGKSTDQLEQDVWQQMQDVARLTAKLQWQGETGVQCSSPEAALPETVSKLSPSAPLQPVSAEERVKARVAAHRSKMPAEVEVWRAMRERTAAAAARNSNQTALPVLADPYLAAGERLSQAGRQEAFSFAAASLVELGPEQRKELLEQTNTAQRLHWLLQAIEPHLGALKAEAAMRQALGDL